MSAFSITDGEISWGGGGGGWGGGRVPATEAHIGGWGWCVIGRVVYGEFKTSESDPTE